MKILRALLILLCITSCDSVESVKKSDETLFYYHTTKQNFATYNSDTVKIEDIQQPDKNDTCLVHSGFKLNGKRHWINLYTNELHCGIDGGYLAYTLDSMGIIYMKSTTWNSYSRLKCTNDSINEIINVALENIILNQSFHDIDLRKLHEEHRGGKKALFE